VGGVGRGRAEAEGALGRFGEGARAHARRQRAEGEQAVSAARRHRALPRLRAQLEGQREMFISMVNPK